jgi:hypothetical protein
MTSWMSTWQAIRVCMSWLTVGRQVKQVTGLFTNNCRSNQISRHESQHQGWLQQQDAEAYSAGRAPCVVLPHSYFEAYLLGERERLPLPDE